MDLDNPKSLLNILPDALKAFALKIPRTYWYKGERALKELAKPDFTDKCLRVNFWQAYCYAQDNDKKINLSHIVSGVTTRNYFMHLAKEHVEKLAFILTPPKEYDVMQRQILDEGLERLRDVVEMEFYDNKEIHKEGANGQTTITMERKINASAIAEVRKVVEMLQDRVQGSVIRKHAIQAQNIPAKTVTPELPPQSLTGLLEVLDKKINDIKQEPEVLDG